MSDRTLDPTRTTIQRERRAQIGASAPWLAVFKREFALYFRSPIAYGVAFALFLFMGFLFNGFLQQANQAAPADLIDVISTLTFLMFLVAPLLTMRLISEETREGTLEVLMTLPMHESQFIIGKFLAAWAYYTIVLLLTLVYQVILYTYGTPDTGVVVGRYLGAWLYGGGVLAVTMIWSAVTEDQIVAAFVGAATVLVLYLADVAAGWLATQGSVQGLAEIVRQLSLQTHFDATLARGILRAEDILYWVLLIVGSLFITTRIVETRRWRG
jgi:ABC-2 type transport system permease protein